MDRRKYLGALAGGTAVGLAGCTALGGETALTVSEEKDRHGTDLLFSDGDGDVLGVVFQHHFRNDDARRHYPIQIRATSQRSGIRISSVRYSFRSPPRSGGFSPAGISLNEDGHAHLADLRRKSDDPSTTVIELSDFEDAYGNGTLVLEILAAGEAARQPQDLWVRVESILESDGFSGEQYTARGVTTLTLPEPADDK
jgi:hypothetical protein